MNIDNLQRILKINSEEKPAAAGCPFGEGVRKCLEETLAIGTEMGFTVKNVDNYGGYIEWKSDNPDAKDMAIIGHLDVVPAGDGWDYDPYGAEVADGYLYGRGTTDDKGPVMVCLEAMKSLKDEGFRPMHNIRLILGCDEETNWKGVEYYFEHESRPDFGFTPDADFPIINGEKGIAHFQLAKMFSKPKVQGLELRSVRGGTAVNAVAAFSRAVVRSPEGYDKVKEIVRAFKDETGYKVNLKPVGKSLEITTEGHAAHAAKPECGLNAISIMMRLLGRMNFITEEQNDFIDFYNSHLGFETDGLSMGVRLQDEPSGSLSLNVGVIELDSESVKLSVDIRYPVTVDAEEKIFPVISEIIDRYDIGFIKNENKLPIYMDESDPMITMLLDIYRKLSGDEHARPIVIGGGTYARSTPGIVAFGAQFPEDEDRMHQKNERVSLKRLDQLFDIYKETIYKLASTEYND